ncbi:MAG: hypothetical protein ABSE05_11345 [Syntrophales bacterium]
MKNQYFGDINDFKKYGLLRLVSGCGEIKLGLCWMLTPNDSQSDGRLLDYLNGKKHWREFDKDLYDFLNYHVLLKKERNIRIIEQSNIISNAIYFSEIVPDDPNLRKKYCEELRIRFKNCDLIFFDPDNGIEVKSKSYGAKGSSKYVYWTELVSTFRDGHSLLIYQHFPRVDRSQYIKKISNELKSRTEALDVHCIYTTNVLFLLVPQRRHIEFFANQLHKLQRNWGVKMKLLNDSHKYFEQHRFEWFSSKKISDTL